MGRGCNTPSFPVPPAPNPNYLHVTTYGTRTVCNPGKPGTPPKTPPGGTIAPGSILPVDPNEETHQRFCGVGGGQAEPSLMSRGMPRSWLGRSLASDQCEGWTINEQTGRGFAEKKGTLPKNHALEKEQHLGQLMEAFTKGKTAWQADPDSFYKLAQLADVPLRKTAIERHKRKNPTHSRQQIRFHPLLHRSQFEALMRPGTNSTQSTLHLPPQQVHRLPGEQPDHMMGFPPRSATTDPMLGNTMGSLRSSPSQVIRTARSLSTLGSRRSGVTDCTQFSRLSQASKENRALREENEKLQRELLGLREGKSTGRSTRSLGSMKSRFSNMSRGGDDVVHALAEKIKNKIYEKFSKLRDAFRNFDKDKSGSINFSELYEALTNLGIPEQDLAGGKLQRLCRMVDQNVDGNINYQEFADKLKVLDTATALIEAPKVGIRAQADAQAAARQLQKHGVMATIDELLG